jgi:hypothetical protein
LDKDYSFVVTALNPEEGPKSEMITLRAAGFPLAPTTIAEPKLNGTSIDYRYTDRRIGLRWP